MGGPALADQKGVLDCIAAPNVEDSPMKWDNQYVTIIREVQEEGVPASPTSGETLELVGHSFRLADPRDRMILNQGREFNIFQTLGQWLWMMAGRSDYGFIRYYHPLADRYSADLRQIEGAYGPRIFGAGAYCQIPHCIELLNERPSSRRAVAAVYTPSLDWHRDKKAGRVGEIPCTLSLQFLKRDGRLHCIASMRSQDALMLLPQDVFHFTLFHEFVAASVKAEMGVYQHNTGSLHLYDKLADRCKRVLQGKIDTAPDMPGMTREDQYPFLLETLALEERIRVNATDIIAQRGRRKLDSKQHLREAGRLPDFWRTVVEGLVGWALLQVKEVDRLEELISNAHPSLQAYLRRARDLGSATKMLDNYDGLPGHSP